MVSYSRFRPTSTIASNVGKANSGGCSRPENELRRALWSLGVRYRCSSKLVPGRPDIVNKSRKVAIFCDGDFWHGRDWHIRRRKLANGSNSPYWISKIASNRRRDMAVNSALLRNGYLVIRVWESDVRKNPARVARTILRKIRAFTDAKVP
jgi:DNA mismatch endonuclease (patch repair protein)